MITDIEGIEVKVGSRVRYWDLDSGGSYGEVVEITSWDGDIDDDTMRTIVQAPAVVVRWDGDDKVETFETSGWIKGEDVGYVEALVVMLGKVAS